MKKEKTHGGLKITINKMLVGWITTAPDRKFSYILARTETRGGKQPLFDTEDQALSALFAEHFKKIH